MNTTYIIGLILVLAIVIPIVLLNHGKNKKNAIIRKKFEALTSNSIIAKQESWNTSIIAIDDVNKTCFFVHCEGENCVEKKLDLTKYSSCRVVTSSSLGTTSNAIDLVELVFTPKQKEDETQSLLFFNSETDGFSLNGELQSAERWKKICCNLIK